jgi:hypothetical protein
MKSVAWEKREKRVRYAIVRDMIRFGFLECKPISVRRSTGLLPSTIDARRDVGEQPTITMATEHAR